jgi:septal ring factor EnvC (AmiA/AmiB activator)
LANWARTYASVPQAQRRISELESELETALSTLTESREAYTRLRAIRFREVKHWQDRYEESRKEVEELKHQKEFLWAIVFKYEKEAQSGKR